MNYKDKLTNYIDLLRVNEFKVDKYTEFKFESLDDFSLLGTKKDLIDWYYNLVTKSTVKLEPIALSDCKNWDLNEKGSISHSSGEFFRVEAYRISGTNSREVTSGWDQPFLTQEGYDGGILGLIRKRFDGIPHYLVEGKEEPGNFNIVQISPTLQATFSNLKRAHKGKATHFSDMFLNPEDHPVEVIFEQWMSEDGGRLFNKRNKSMLIEFDEKIDLPLPSERFKWVSLHQLKSLILEENAIVAPHIRGILAGI